MERIVEKPHLPKGKVGLLALGERYGAQLASPLYALGVQALWIPDARFSDRRLAGHAGDLIARCGISTEVSSTNMNILLIKR